MTPGSGNASIDICVTLRVSAAVISSLRKASRIEPAGRLAPDESLDATSPTAALIAFASEQ